jgi:hypothetical protein
MNPFTELAAELQDWRPDTSQCFGLTWHGLPVMRVAHEIQPKIIEEYVAVGTEIRTLLRGGKL